MPAPRRLGRPRKTDLREILNALLYIASTGCQCRMLPKDFPPCSTAQRYFYEWRAMELEGKEASPTAGAIDSQSVKTTESGGIRGFDAGKKIKRRKRHIIVDTLGLMVGLMVHSADIQDRDGAPDLLKSCRAAGSSSGPSHGLVDTAGWPTASKIPSLQQKRGSQSPTSASACSQDVSQDMDIVEAFSSPTLSQGS